MSESFTDTPLLSARFDSALHYATRHHARQLRKGTPIPYAAHILAAASLVLEMHGDEDEAIGALLHDVVEDGGGRRALAEIEAAFGPAVAALVAATSDTLDPDEDRRGGAGWYARKRAYVDAIAHKQPDELRVSLADKLHNARAILLDYRTHGDGLWDRFKAGEGDSIRWYYRSLFDAFAARRDALGERAVPALEELGRTIAEIDRLAGAARPASPQRP